jgi:hypothetical protein
LVFLSFIQLCYLTVFQLWSGELAWVLCGSTRTLDLDFS